MGRNTRIAGLALCTGLMVWHTEAAEAQIADPSIVRVVITDLTGVPAGTLERAKDEATRLFERSQINLEWIGDEACHARCLFVRIVARPIGKKSGNPFVLGIAPGTTEVRGRHAWLFYDRIQVFSRQLGLELSQMLGLVMAHELGHLLLPYGAHALAGVMRPAWDRAQVKNAADGLLNFTADQAALIRERLQASASPIAHAR